MLFKISLKNIKSSIKDYLIYFFTLVIGVAIFYVFNSIESQTVMMKVSSNTLEIIKNKHDDMPAYILNKQYDLFAEINRIYVEKVEDEEVLILSDEAQKEVKEDYKDYKN